MHFDEAMRSADFMSLHMPLTPSTKNMFDKSTFAKMKPGEKYHPVQLLSELWTVDRHSHCQCCARRCH